MLGVVEECWGWRSAQSKTLHARTSVDDVTVDARKGGSSGRVDMRVTG